MFASTRGFFCAPGQKRLAQPLPPADGKDAGDAAKMVEKSITDALKGMKPYKDCINDLRANKFDEAEKNARLGIAAYGNSVLSRICLLQAQTGLKAPPDSIIATANAILAVDPTSVVTLANLVDAYKAKGDKDKAVEVNLRIWRLDPTNQSIAQSIVTDLAQSGAPDKALQILDTLLKENPSDPPMVKQKWLLQLKAGQFKNALTTGEELMKVDTAAANLDFYNRQIGAAQSDSNAAKVQEWASKAAQKFPTDASFPTLLAQSYRKSGQLQQALASARRAAQIDPKNSNAWLFAVVTANDLNMPDSAIAFAQQAVAAGADKASLGQALLAVVNPAVKKATDSKDRGDWEAALKIAQTVDAARSERSHEVLRRSGVVPGRSRCASERAEAWRSEGQGREGGPGQGLFRDKGHGRLVGDFPDRDPPRRRVQQGRRWPDHGRHPAVQRVHPQVEGDVLHHEVVRQFSQEPPAANFAAGGFALWSTCTACIEVMHVWRKRPAGCILVPRRSSRSGVQRAEVFRDDAAPTGGDRRKYCPHDDSGRPGRGAAAAARATRWTADAEHALRCRHGVFDDEQATRRRGADELRSRSSPSIRRGICTRFRRRRSRRRSRRRAIRSIRLSARRI